MARYYKKTRTTRRKAAPKRRYYRKRATAYRKRSYKGRKLALKSANLPLGNRCTAKLPYTQNSALVGDGILSVNTSAVFDMNSLVNFPANSLTDNRAASFLPRQFQHYRVRGVGIKLTAMVSAESAPSFMYIHAYMDNNACPLTDRGDLGALAQYPCTRYKLMNPRDAKGWTTLSMYIPMSKLVGSRKWLTDDQYEGGTTNPVPGIYAWTAPILTNHFVFGFGRVDQVAIAPAVAYQFRVTTTYYCDFYTPSEKGVE